MYSVWFQLAAPRCGRLRLPCSERYVHLVAVLGILHTVSRQERQCSAQIIWIWENSVPGTVVSVKGLIHAPNAHARCMRGGAHACCIVHSRLGGIVNTIDSIIFTYHRMPSHPVSPYSLFLV